MFIKIAITPFEIIENEARKITDILSSDRASYVHLRHPENSPEEIEDIIREIPTCWHDRLTLHDNYDLAERFAIGGLHLNSRNPELSHKFKNKHLRISRACHTLVEIEQFSESDNPPYDYLTLSPIFDSISKPNYKANFQLEDLKEILQRIPVKIIALGGVNPYKFEILKNTGFGGAAMLGYFWK